MGERIGIFCTPTISTFSRGNDALPQMDCFMGEIDLLEDDCSLVLIAVSGSSLGDVGLIIVFEKGKWIDIFSESGFLNALILNHFS